MPMNKYKKLLKEKKKIVQSPNQVGDTKEKKKFHNYFNPNKYVKSNNEFFVRVLPRKNDLFFIQFKKHSFKIGTSWKNAFCFYSHNNDGEMVGNECPFCDFIEENKSNLDKDTLYKIGAKNSHMLLVYNPQADEVQKYEVNDYGITDILTAMQSNLEEDLDDNFDVDKDGFDLYFRKGSSGYAEVYKVEKPSVTISDLKESSKNFDEIPDLEKEAIPPFIEPVRKSIKSMLELAINIFEPTFANKGNEEETEEEEETILSNREDEFDPNKEDFDIKDEVIETDDEDEDEDVEDIKKFLKNRKK